jgi:Subtilase family
MATKRRAGGDPGNGGAGRPDGTPHADEARSRDRDAPPVGEPPTGLAPPPAAERELVVRTAAAAGVRAAGPAVSSATGSDVSDLTTVLAEEGVTLEPLFGQPEEVLQARAAALAGRVGAPVPDLSVYYRVRAEDGRLGALAERLRQIPAVEAAYVKPGAEPAVAPVLPRGLLAAPTATPDFSARQGYRGAPPEGVDAVWAAGQAGGTGSGVQIVDVEGAWELAHEDLLQNNGGVIAGTPTDDVGWRNHGTAVFGEFGADSNGLGVEGIAPGAVCRGASIFGGTGSAGAIRQAAEFLAPGDVLLIELHRPGPRFDFQDRLDQRGYIAVEYFPDDLDAIRYAVARGVVVVEAAGNGAEDLDDPLYDQAPDGFPADWRNPFDPGNPGSGAVLVGAGAPPPGTHGRDHGPDRSRLDFSNFGRRLDAQGWGREVTTTGYGDLQGGQDPTAWYTDVFSGTSSASPIVVGALAAAQGILQARGRARLTPAQAVAALRATGSPQQDAPGRPASQRIGNRPDIRALVESVVPAEVQSGTATRYWDEAVPYPPQDGPRLWLLVDDAWRVLPDPDRSTRDLVQRAFLGTDQEVRVWYQDGTAVGLVVTGN